MNISLPNLLLINNLAIEAHMKLWMGKKIAQHK